MLLLPVVMILVVFKLLLALQQLMLKPTMQIFTSYSITWVTHSWQTLEQWLAEDANDPGHQLLSDDEIVAMIRSNEDDSGAKSGSDIESQPSMSHAEACNAFSTALKWLESQGDI